MKTYKNITISAVFFVMYLLQSCSEKKEENAKLLVPEKLLPPITNVNAIELRSYGFNYPYRQPPVKGIIPNADIYVLYNYVSKLKKEEKPIKASPLLIIIIKTKSNKDVVLSVLLKSKQKGMLEIDNNFYLSIESMEDFKKLINAYMTSSKLM